MNTAAHTMANTVATPGSAPEWLRELATAKTVYEEQWGWPVSVDVAQRRLIVPVGQALDAVTTPAPLGKCIQAALRIMMLAGPVVASPGSQWLTFLTEPATGPSPVLHSTLHRLKVHPIPFGAHAIIPTHLDGTGTWQWAHLPPPRRPLPPWAVVIGAARKIATAPPPVAADKRTDRPSPAG
jgi:hypothetical protein